VAPVVRAVRHRVSDAVLGGHRVQRDGVNGRRHHGQAEVAVRGARVRAVPAVRHGRRGRPLRDHQRAVGRRQRRRRGCSVPRDGHRDRGPVHRPTRHVRRARVFQRVRPHRLRRAAPDRRRRHVGRAFRVHVRHTRAHAAFFHAIFPVQVRTAV